MNRRELNAALVAAILCATMERRALAAPMAGVGADAIARIAELGRALRGREITSEQWSEAIVALVEGIALDDLLQRIDFERLTEGMTIPDRAAGVARIPLDTVAAPGLTLKVFALRRDCALVPHAHDGIASMHMVVRGRLRGRHWNRVGEESGYLLLQPTADRIHRRGDASTATADRDNAHWFVAETRLAFAFGVAVNGLDPDRPSRRVYLDPDLADTGPGDVLRVPVIDLAVAVRRYGRARE